MYSCIDGFIGAMDKVGLPAKDELLLIDAPFMGVRGSAHMVQRLWNVFIRGRLEEQKRAAARYCGASVQGGNS